MKIRKRIILSATVFAVTASLSAHGRLDVNKQLDYCVEHISLSLKSLSRGGAIDYSKSPKDILKGQHCWNLQNNTPGAWTWGFWPGILWMDYSYTKDEKVKAEAEKFTHSLNYLSHRPAYDHDLGFLVFLSYEKAYNETGDKTYKKTIINTAERLASLYNPKVGTILSWPHEAMDKGRYQPYNTIIDNMINLEILFWAADNGGGKKLRDIAISHADVTMKSHFRSDFTSYHVAIYDTLTGCFIKGKTNQGYANSSVWSRGQAWAIYGYTMCYRKTDDRRYLNFAQKVSDAHLSRLPDDYVPYWEHQVQEWQTP